MSTHEVTNQSPPLSDYNVVLADPALREGIARWGRAQDQPELEALGALAGGVDAQAWGEQADGNPPVLHTHSPQGARIDEVEFHPAWHRLLDTAVSYGLTAEPWTRPPGSGAHLRRVVGFVAWSQVESGHLCPVSMTYAAVPALQRSPDLSAIWTPLLASRDYDFGLRPHAQKGGVLAGMGMTEKQGGSDIRSNTTAAVAVAGGPIEGGHTYRLTGHKWFCSAPMSDLFLGSSATMRQALVRAVHHTRHRQAFGRTLVEQPLMRNVLMDLALESEAATTLGLRLAAAVDDGDTAFSRLGVAVGKYWVCKRTSPMVAEALECLGGNGFVEENGLARLYREAPLNSIWEGSGNVNALDVIRAVTREPASVEAFESELNLASGANSRLDLAIKATVSAIQTASSQSDPEAAQSDARALVEQLATSLQACLLTRFAPAYLSEAFVASRLSGAHGHTFGTLPSDLVTASAGRLIERAFPG